MKKHYKEVSVASDSGVFHLLLDDLPARTPQGKCLSVPSETLIQAIAQEWQEQPETIRKETMPLTQAAIIAIDVIAGRRAAVTEDLLAYAQTDLVCYRATEPALAERQAELLDPVVCWAEGRFRIALRVTCGVIPVAQPPGNRTRLEAALAAYDDWRLAALSIAARSSGSLILALALADGRIDAARAFELSHLEEQFETESWGEDAEKETKLRQSEETLASVERFLTLLQK